MHEYQSIDLSIIKTIIERHLDDMKLFVSIIILYHLIF